MNIFEKISTETKKLKAEYDHRKKINKLDELHIKEASLNSAREALIERERSLEKLAIELEKKELSLKKIKRRPIQIFLLCMTLWFLSGAFVFQNYNLTKKAPAIRIIANKKDATPKDALNNSNA